MRRIHRSCQVMVLTAFLLVGCDIFADDTGRLSASIVKPSRGVSRGETQLALSFSGRDGFLYIPNAYDPDTPMPLFVVLHGAGGSSTFWKTKIDSAEAQGFIILAPDSRLATWDVASGTFGDDLKFIDRALKYVFDRVNIDPDRLVLAGFSDGASFSLSLGITNGNLFSHVIAYSPGFLLSDNPTSDKPLIYISHGSGDSILPIGTTRWTIIPELERKKYDVVFNQFSGGHTLPSSVFNESLDWFMGGED